MSDVPSNAFHAQKYEMFYYNGLCRRIKGLEMGPQFRVILTFQRKMKNIVVGGQNIRNRICFIYRLLKWKSYPLMMSEALNELQAQGFYNVPNLNGGQIIYGFIYFFRFTFLRRKYSTHKAVNWNKSSEHALKCRSWTGEDKSCRASMDNRVKL